MVFSRLSSPVPSSSPSTRPSSHCRLITISFRSFCLGPFGHPVFVRSTKWSIAASLPENSIATRNLSFLGSSDTCALGLFVLPIDSDMFCIQNSYGLLEKLHGVDVLRRRHHMSGNWVRAQLTASFLDGADGLLEGAQNRSCAQRWMSKERYWVKDMSSAVGSQPRSLVGSQTLVRPGLFPVTWGSLP